jgi:adenylate cyclase
MMTLKPEAFDQAGDLLRRAVAQDPGFPAIHAALADWHSLRWQQEWSPDPRAEIAAMEAALRQTLALDGNHARALALVGHQGTILRGQHEAAQPLFDRALETAPNESAVWLWSALTPGFMGRPGETIRRAERAIALSPEDPFIFQAQHFLSLGHYLSGDYEQAAELGLQSHAGNPRYSGNLCMTAASLAASGRKDEARALARQVLVVKPGFRLSRLRKRLPFRDRAVHERYIRHLEDAGLPA